MRWAPDDDERGRSKDLQLSYVRGGAPLAVLRKPKLAGKEVTRLVVSMTCEEDFMAFMVLSAVAIAGRSPGKVDFMGALFGFGAVGV